MVPTQCELCKLGKERERDLRRKQRREDLVGDAESLAFIISRNRAAKFDNEWFKKHYDTDLAGFYKVNAIPLSGR